MNAPATTASQRYLDSFPTPVDEFAIEGLDVLDVPLHSAVLPSSPEHPGGSGLGYGATREEARTGALGEQCANRHRRLVSACHRDGTYAGREPHRSSRGNSPHRTGGGATRRIGRQHAAAALRPARRLPFPYLVG